MKITNVLKDLLVFFYSGLVLVINKIPVLVFLLSLFSLILIIDWNQNLSKQIILLLVNNNLRISCR